jgi:hypothetical protein
VPPTGRRVAQAFANLASVCPELYEHTITAKNGAAFACGGGFCAPGHVRPWFAADLSTS